MCGLESETEVSTARLARLLGSVGGRQPGGRSRPDKIGSWHLRVLINRMYSALVMPWIFFCRRRKATDYRVLAKRCWLCPVLGLFFIVLLGMTVVSCTQVHVEPLRTSTERHGIVRIVVREAPAEELKFLVLNLTDDPLQILYDKIVVEAYFGRFGRSQGDAETVYTVAPHGSRQLSLKFSAKGLRRGDELTVYFDDAILRNGEPVSIEPLGFMVMNDK